MTQHERVKREKDEELVGRCGKNKIQRQIYDQRRTPSEGAVHVMYSLCRPLIERHAGLLADAHSDEQRASLVLQLQMTYGNAYLQRLLGSKTAQTRLAVNPLDDVSFMPRAEMVGLTAGQVQPATDTAWDVYVPSFEVPVTIIRGGITVPTPLFGATMPDVKLDELKVTVEDYLGHVGVSVMCPVEIHWDVNSNGRKHVSGADDPEVTEHTWKQIVSDLTPQGSPPQCRFDKYWCEDLAERHEKYHCDDLKAGLAVSSFLAHTWLETQTVSSAMDAENAGYNAINSMLGRINNERGPTQGPAALSTPFEARAYLDGAPLYQDRVDAIVARAAREGWP